MPDLDQLLRDAAARIDTTPPGIEAASTAARRRRRRRTAVISIALVAVLGAALAVAPRLGGDAEPDTLSAASFPALAADEQLAELAEVELTPGGQTLVATFGPACSTRQRWDFLQASDAVRARLVLTVPPGAPCPLGLPDETTISPFLDAPLAERGLVVESATGDVVLRQRSVEPFPPLPARTSLALFPTFAVGGRQVTASNTAGACETPGTWEVRESTTEVRVRLTVRDTTPPGAGCAAVGLSGRASTGLAAPLGDRRLIRIGDDGAVDVTPGR